MRARRSASACTEPRDRVVRAANLGDDLRAGRIVKRASIGHLPAGLGVNRGTVEHDLARFARLQLGDGSILGNNRADTSVLCTRSKVKVRLRLMRLSNLRVSWIRRLFSGATLPRRTRTRTLLLHRPVELRPIHRHVAIACRIFNEVSRNAKCIREIEGILAR